MKLERVALGATLLVVLQGCNHMGPEDVVWSLVQLRETYSPLENVEEVAFRVRYSDCADVEEDYAIAAGDENFDRLRAGLCDSAIVDDVAPCSVKVTELGENFRRFQFAIEGDFVGRVFALGPIPLPQSVDCDPYVELFDVTYSNSVESRILGPIVPIVLRGDEPPFNF